MYVIIIICSVVEIIAYKHGLEFKNSVKTTIRLVCLFLFFAQIIINRYIKRERKGKSNYGTVVIISFTIILFVLIIDTNDFSDIVNEIFIGGEYEYVENTKYGKKVVFFQDSLLYRHYEIHDYYNEFLWSRKGNYYAPDYIPSNPYLDKKEIEEIILNDLIY